MALAMQHDEEPQGVDPLDLVPIPLFPTVVLIPIHTGRCAECGVAWFVGKDWSMCEGCGSRICKPCVDELAVERCGWCLGPEAA